MRAIFLVIIAGAFLASAAASAAAAPRSKAASSPTPSREVLIECPINLACAKVFNDDESIVGKVRYGGVPHCTDLKKPCQSDWEVVASHGPPSQILITVKRVGAFTNIIVPLNDGDFVIYVRGMPRVDRPTAGVVAMSPATPTPQPRVFVTLPPPPPTPPPDPLGGVDLRTLDCSRYVARDVVGHPDFHPTQICVDSDRVYIQIPAAAELPAIAALTQGVYHLVDASFEDNYFIVVGHAQSYALRRGSGKEAQEVDVVLASGAAK